MGPVGLALKAFGVGVVLMLVGHTFVWAFGDIVPGGETSFAFEAMPGAFSYGIAVISYDLVSGPAGYESR